MCSQGGFRWVLCELGWNQVDFVCVVKVESGGFCVSQGGIRWVPCV